MPKGMSSLPVNYVFVCIINNSMRQYKHPSIINIMKYLDERGVLGNVSILTKSYYNNEYEV